MVITTINPSYCSYVHPLSYRKRGAHSVVPVHRRRLGGDETPAVPVMPLAQGSLVLEETMGSHSGLMLMGSRWKNLQVLICIYIYIHMFFSIHTYIYIYICIYIYMYVCILKAHYIFK